MMGVCSMNIKYNIMGHNSLQVMLLQSRSDISLDQQSVNKDYTVGSQVVDYK